MSKDWYRSKTIWGAAVALSGALAGLFGVETSAEAGEALTSALTDLATALGAVLAIFGRFRAVEAIR
jgi:hypothetical protein